MQMLMQIHMQLLMQMHILKLIQTQMPFQIHTPIHMQTLIQMLKQIHLQIPIHMPMPMQTPKRMLELLSMQQLNQNHLLLIFLLRSHFQLFNKEVKIHILKNSFLQWLMDNFQEISICIMTQLWIKVLLQNQQSHLSNPIFRLSLLKLQVVQVLQLIMMEFEKLMLQFTMITQFT